MKIRRLLLLLAAVALLIVSAAVLYHDTKAKPISVGNLAVAQGQITSYTLLDDSRGTHQYVISLSGYQATFQIPSDFAPYFDKSRFQAQVKNGDSISLSIIEKNTAKLTSPGTVPVFAIRTKSATYLEEHATVAAYNDKINPPQQSPSVYWSVYCVIAVIFVVLLIVLAFGLWKTARMVSARRPDDISDPQALLESSQRMKKSLAKIAPEQKSLTIPEQKLLTTGDVVPELLTTVESKPDSTEPPQG